MIPYGVPASLLSSLAGRRADADGFMRHSLLRAMAPCEPLAAE